MLNTKLHELKQEYYCDNEGKSSVHCNSRGHRVQITSSSVLLYLESVSPHSANRPAVHYLLRPIDGIILRYRSGQKLLQASLCDGALSFLWPAISQLSHYCSVKLTRNHYIQRQYLSVHPRYLPLNNVMALQSSAAARLGFPPALTHYGADFSSTGGRH